MPPTDFTDLAARMATDLAGVRACLILSRDGLSLGAHPADGESKARQVWDAWQRMGDPQRGFVDMGTEIWVVACDAVYAAVMVATPEAKPGVLLDRMSAQLLAAEERRAIPAVQPATVVDLSAAESGGAAPATSPPARGTVDRVALAREFGRLLEGDSSGGI